MDTVATQSSLIINYTNTSCSTPLLWSQQEIDNRKSRLIVCIIAVFVHAIFWLQPIFCSTVRQKSMQWIYAYLVTDIFLIFRFFFTYIVRTTTTECDPDPAWVTFICYFDAVFDNYFNVLEVYILLALNICRYIQITQNKNVYEQNKTHLICAHLGIYLGTAISLVIQFALQWAQLLVIFRNSCQVTYTNIYIQVFNIITAFALPIFLNIVVIYMSVRHVRLASTLQRTTHVSAREKYNRTLVIQFLVFYLIWVSLWSPNVILYQVSGGQGLSAVFRLLNFIEIALDPIILAALDVRFWQAWQRCWKYMKARVWQHGPSLAQIQPTTRINTLSAKTPQLRTTAC